VRKEQDWKPKLHQKELLGKMQREDLIFKLKYKQEEPKS